MDCIVIVLSMTKIICLKIIFPNVIKSKAFQYPSIVFLSILPRRCIQNFIALFLRYLIDKITHMVMKIAVTPEYEVEKDTFTQTGYLHAWIKRGDRESPPPREITKI